MSIFFELDGPYRAMIIPAAREEGSIDLAIEISSLKSYV